MITIWIILTAAAGMIPVTLFVKNRKAKTAGAMGITAVCAGSLLLYFYMIHFTNTRMIAMITVLAAVFLLLLHAMMAVLANVLYRAKVRDARRNERMFEGAMRSVPCLWDVCDVHEQTEPIDSAMCLSAERRARIEDMEAEARDERQGSAQERVFNQKQADMDELRELSCVGLHSAAEMKIQKMMEAGYVLLPEEQKQLQMALRILHAKEKTI